MDWTAQIDNYCERLGPGFWAEPINAVTNLAFIIAAVIMYRRVRSHDLPLAHLMCAVLAAIGVGSFLFHTFATRWAAAADTAPILIFVLVFTYAAALDFLRQTPFWAAVITLAFFPFTALVVQVTSGVGWLGSSVGYLPIVLWIAGFAVLVPRQVAWGMWTVLALLILSLTLRTLDMPMCDRAPMGTHFLWHCLNALLLAWLIETYRRHMVPAAGKTA